MKPNELLKDLPATAVISLFYAVGIVGHLLPLALPLMIQLTPWVLLIFGLYTFAAISRQSRGPLLFWAVFAYLFTFAMEAIGVATGSIFGVYQYGETLGIQFIAVPLVIGFNWVIIVLGISSLVFERVKNPLIGALLTGIGATVFDWVMEPAAIALGYWSWAEVTIPLQNYAAWFLIAALCAFGFRLLRIRVDSRLGLYYVLVQTLFFVLLRLGGAKLG